MHYEATRTLTRKVNHTLNCSEKYLNKREIKYMGNKGYHSGHLTHTHKGGYKHFNI